MTASESAPARQAALLLHGLPSAQRERVLARLDAVESRRLKPLLDELNGLGISQAMGRQLRHLASSASDSAGRVPTLVERVERLSAHDVVRCLKTCASVTVARLLWSRDWPWRNGVLDRLPGALRLEVTNTLRNDWPALAPAVLESLYERLCRDVQRLHDLPAHARTAEANKHSVRRWFEWTR